MGIGPTLPVPEPTPPGTTPQRTATPQAPRPGDVFNPNAKLDPSQVNDRRPQPGNVGMYGTVASAQATQAPPFYPLPPLVEPYRPY